MSHSQILLNQDVFFGIACGAGRAGAGGDGAARTAAGDSTAGAAAATDGVAYSRRRGACRRDGGEISEKLVGHVFGDAVDETRAELGDLAADIRLDVVVQQRSAGGVCERHFRPALGEAGDAALALALDGVADERRKVGELHLASEGRRNRPDFRLDHGGEAVVAGFFQRLAARDAGLEHLRVVEQRPDLRPIGGQGHVARHRHGHRRFLPRSVRRYTGARAIPRLRAIYWQFFASRHKDQDVVDHSPDFRRSWTCRRVAISHKGRRESLARGPKYLSGYHA